ncbi:uncharacterized protein LOC111259672 [Varroa jacobsoni]|uniref:Matrix-remodeling-associated protein 7 helical domain-containing protein n=1 Tax=Varroa destructor TaxID=109461 RepID=A0A7M7JCX6_VARDE|nr:uncharacterized protein LOC111245725 [Varroa destructor]XP_022687579.1 uncharacterized protein LOC111259672 [Varroa jacobsoni]XP_022687581.1 uncharacterized protein LOC111259672 [Varroa jacobsoni]
MSVEPTMARGEEKQYSESQIPEILELFGDLVQRHHGVIVLTFSTLICLVLSGMFILRQRIRAQEDAHKNCKNRFEIFDSRGTSGSVINKQPISRPIIFSESVPDSALDTMAEKKAELIRAEKLIARSLTGGQRSTEAEVQRQQLEAICKLMEENQDKFGEASLDQVQSQAALYGR